jgi:putative tryptophan/tyrosine transport system substrate-binding protein
MRRREFIAGLGAAAWPLAARAQQRPLPVIGFVSGESLEALPSGYLAAFRAGLRELGYVDGQNVSIEYHWLEGQFDRVPALVAELVGRGVAVIATPGNLAAALAPKAATSTIPIVFGIGDNPVRLGIVASLSRPGGNATGMNIFVNEAVPKRLGLLRELVPNANRVAVLVNPSNIANAKANLREVKDAARLVGLPIDILKASTSREIEAAFATMAGERVEALFVTGDTYFLSRRLQLATRATRHGIPTSDVSREFVEAGGLMSYGTDLAAMYHQVGAYTGRILKGAKPADLPVVQSTKFEFAINMQTAKALGVKVPPRILATADVVIE